MRMTLSALITGLVMSGCLGSPPPSPTPNVEGTVQVRVTGTVEALATTIAQEVRRPTPAPAPPTATAAPARAAQPSTAKSSTVLLLEQHAGMTVEQAQQVARVCSSANLIALTEDQIRKCATAQALIETIADLNRRAVFDSVP